MGNEPVSDEELSDSIANMTGTLPLRLETNDGVASILLNMEWYDLGLDYLQTYQERIRAITKEDVQRVARRLSAHRFLYTGHRRPGRKWELSTFESPACHSTRRTEQGL